MAQGFQGFTDTSLSHQAKPLPATSGKTPAGSGPKPPAKKAPAKAPASPPAAASLADPQMTALLAQQAQQRQAIQDATRQYLGMLQAQPNVQNDYANAAGQIGGLGAAAAQFLQGQNPNPQIQHDLAHVGGGQAAQIAAALGNAFNGGAGALFAQHALVPGTLLAENGSAAAALQKSQAPNIALQGLNSLRQANYDSTQALANLKTNSASGGANGLKYFSSGGNEYVVGADGKVQQLTNNQKSPAVKYFSSGGNEFVVGPDGKVQQITNNQGAGPKPKYFSSGGNEYVVDPSSGKVTQITNNPRTGGRSSVPPNLKSVKVGNKTVLVDPKTGQPVKTFTAPPKNTSNGGRAYTQSDALKFVKSVTKTSSVSVGSSAKGGVVRTSEISGHTMPYEQAYNYLRSKGVSDRNARSYLDTSYQRGQDGRSWFTNEEQTALRKAKQPISSGVIDIQTKGADGKPVGKREYITKAQAVVLRRAGRLMPGFWFTSDQGTTVYVIKPGR